MQALSRTVSKHTPTRKCGDGLNIALIRSICQKGSQLHPAFRNHAPPTRQFYHPIFKCVNGFCSERRSFTRKVFSDSLLSAILISHIKVALFIFPKSIDKEVFSTMPIYYRCFLSVNQPHDPWLLLRTDWRAFLLLPHSKGSFSGAAVPEPVHGCQNTLRHPAWSHEPVGQEWLAGRARSGVHHLHDWGCQEVIVLRRQQSDEVATGAWRIWFDSKTTVMYLKPFRLREADEKRLVRPDSRKGKNIVKNGRTYTPYPIGNWFKKPRLVAGLFIGRGFYPAQQPQSFPMVSLISRPISSKSCSCSTSSSKISRSKWKVIGSLPFTISNNLL